MCNIEICIICIKNSHLCQQVLTLLGYVFPLYYLCSLFDTNVYPNYYSIYYTMLYYIYYIYNILCPPLYMGFKLECVCCVLMHCRMKELLQQQPEPIRFEKIVKLLRCLQIVYVNNVLMIHFHLLDIYMYNKGLLTRILVHVLCIVCVSDFL